MNKLGPLMPGMVFEFYPERDKSIPKVTEVVEYALRESIEMSNDWLVGYSDLIPIPLTPEILRDWFGFAGSDYLYIGGIRVRWNWPTRSVVFNYGTDYYFSAKHVHELQRLLAGLGLDHKVTLPQ